MFDTVFGLPTHILVVHAIVVLVPLAALALLVLAVRPASRWRLGWPLAGFVVVVSALIPLATHTGEQLLRRVGRAPAIAHHAQLGHQLLWVGAPMPILAVLLVLLERNRRPRAPQPRLLRAVAVLAVMVAVAVGVQIVRAGHSGASAVWRPIVQNTTSR